jgi:hypothetical protein
MSRVLRIMARRLGKSSLELLDQQSYWLYRFGTAA